MTAPITSRPRTDHAWRAVRPLGALGAVPARRVGRRRRARQLPSTSSGPRSPPRPAPTAPSCPGPATPGTAAAIASALRGWNHLRFEVTEDPTAVDRGARYSYTPDLGVFHAVTGLHGDIMIPEDRLKAAVVKAALGDTTLLARDRQAARQALGRRARDLPPRRRGRPGRWLHQVV